MKKFVICFFIFSFFSGTILKAERYKSLNERGGSTSNQSDSRYQRYENKPSSDKQRFDQNLNKYNTYSPEERRQATEKWRNFKQETTPEERKFIMNKMRDNSQERRNQRQ